MASYLPDGAEDSLETRLNKATNPLQAEENWEYIVGFCDLINKDIDGPQIAVRLLVHKIQSPQEKEALFALTTLEACVRNCGQKFQQEIGKFRFINEIIKIVSPKYLGSQRTTRVKNRCITLLYFWSQILTEEPKIKEAYQMLKKQGIVKEDPDIYQLPSSGLSSGLANSQPSLTPPPKTPPKNSIFEDEEKSKLLSRLLKSKNPDDLQAANRLIKNMVKQDAERTEKVTRRTQQLETVSNNVKLLNEMLQNYQPGNSTESDREIMKELSENIEKQRPALFRLASDSDERDSTGISEILRANDEVIQVLSLYDSLINKSDVGNLLAIEETDGVSNFPPATPSNVGNSTTDDAKKAVNDLDFDVLASPTNHVDRSLLDEQLLFLGVTLPAKEQMPSAVINEAARDVKIVNNVSKSGIDELSDIFAPSSYQVPLIGDFSCNSSLQQTATSALPNYFVSTSGYAPSVLSGHSTTSVGTLRPSSSSSSVPADSGVDVAVPCTESALTKTFQALDELSKSLLQQTLSSSGLKPFQPASNPTKVTLNQMGKSSLSTKNSAAPTITTTTTTSQKTNNVAPKPLDDIFIPLETIRPGSKPSKTVHCENDVVSTAHFASERPRSDVEVVAITTTSTSRFPIKDLLLQVRPADEQQDRVLVKMQPASSSSLPAYNPILPPSAVTQVVLVSIPSSDINAKLKIQVSYLLNETHVKTSTTIDL